jgi:hypothetical protein
MNLRRGAQELNLSLWLVGRGTSPSSSSTSRSRPPRRPRRGTPPDPPAADHAPCTELGIHRTTTSHAWPAEAPQTFPPPSRRRWRRRRRDAVEEEEPKSPTRSPPPSRRSRPGSLAPRLPGVTPWRPRGGGPEHLIRDGGVDTDRTPPANPNLHLSTRRPESRGTSPPPHRRRSDERRERKPTSSATVDGRNPGLALSPLSTVEKGREEQMELCRGYKLTSLMLPQPDVDAAPYPVADAAHVIH